MVGVVVVGVVVVAGVAVPVVDPLAAPGFTRIFPVDVLAPLAGTVGAGEGTAPTSALISGGKLNNDGSIDL